MSLRAVIYLRVRTGSDVDPAATEKLINEQFIACIDEINRLGARLVDVFADIGESANNFHRSGLTGLLWSVRSPLDKIDLVVITSKDRLARNVVALPNIVRKIERAGTRLHVVTNVSYRRAA